MRNATEWLEAVKIDVITDEFLLKTLMAIQADALLHAASIAKEYKDGAPIAIEILMSIPV